jgi:hypothetical protein
MLPSPAAAALGGAGARVEEVVGALDCCCCCCCWEALLVFSSAEPSADSLFPPTEAAFPALPVEAAVEDATPSPALALAAIGSSTAVAAVTERPLSFAVLPGSCWCWCWCWCCPTLSSVAYAEPLAACRVLLPTPGKAAQSPFFAQAPSVASLPLVVP